MKILLDPEVLERPAQIPRKLLLDPPLMQSPALQPTKKLLAPEVMFGAQVLQERKLEVEQAAIAPPEIVAQVLSPLKYVVEFLVPLSPRARTGTVPVVRQVAFKLDEEVRFPLAVPVKDAVIVPALKLPEPSRATIVDTLFALVALDATVNVAAPELLNVVEPDKPVPDVLRVNVFAKFPLNVVAVTTPTALMPPAVTRIPLLAVINPTESTLVTSS